MSKDTSKLSDPGTNRDPRLTAFFSSVADGMPTHALGHEAAAVIAKIHQAS